MSTPVPGRMRARDLDRAHTASVLDAAYAEGQLGADEYHDRIAQAGAAKTVGDLSALVDDLQTPSAASTGRPRDPAAEPAGRPAGDPACTTMNSVELCSRAIRVSAWCASGDSANPVEAPRIDGIAGRGRSSG
ncbi:DUF1707 SHOCT-like domain-containing protein, partial [Nocardia cyriacigeorgica]|uniref:DUF1707 SHOCT-like domain-containing protein n=1 Tax=Nocardia cyriacigeorgica TaxID=135487 RepID=UPI002458B177